MTMTNQREVHWRNKIDAERALFYLEQHTEAFRGRSVIRHSLIAIRERAKYVLDEIEELSQMESEGDMT